MKSLGYGLLAIGLLIILFLFTKPQNQPPSLSQSPLPSDSLPTSAPTSTPQSFSLVVQNRKLVSGPETIQVREGDEVEIKVTSDEAEELHLHGYNQSVDLEKDEPATLRFLADKSGRYEYELEHSGTPLGVIEVQPQ